MNPDLAGDVLSPRWSTEDTDEQPAIQVSGNETYILPDKGADPQREGVRDVLDPPAPYDVLGGGQDVLDAPSGAHDVLGAPSGAHDVLGAPSGAHDVLGGASGAHDVLGGAQDAAYQDGRGYQDERAYQDEREQGRYADDSGPFPVENEPGYLPLDRGYDQGFDAGDDEPRRGFLGAGWSEESDDDYHARGEREVRRRTRTLLVAAAAVVVLGVGVGWVLTGASSDDSCAGGQCTSAGQVNTPAESALPEDEPVEEEEAEPEPTDSADQEERTPRDQQGDAGTPADQPASTVPTHTEQRTRPTREPSERPRSTRTAEPAQDTDEEQVRVPANREGGNGGVDRGGRTADENDSRQDDAPRSNTGQDEEAQAPTEVTEQPEQPQQEEDKGNGGLLGILFPWL
ncbi:hypothetical protein [Nonomuraea maritima]|uniref:hypothetical protein n=1 Tax=Nonomuraea maritima TaxID=683260 RepID=UPI003715DF4F